MRVHIHELKTHPPFFRAVYTREKPFEVRRDDRDFRVGDSLVLREWDPETESYTGRSCYRRVTYKLEGGRFGVEPGFCILGIR